jgi:YebC/PmpR family DNA-binding regulatory protein
MAGHNKWSKIKRQKAVNDTEKGRIFGEVGKMIRVAARKGTDPEQNTELRSALEKAKKVNMPKKNIDRALKSAAEKSGEEMLYEGFGPEGVGILIKVYTDNTNRTVGEVRHILSGHGGSLGTNGSAQWMFETITPLQEYRVSIQMPVSEDAQEKCEQITAELEELDDVEQVWTSIPSEEEAADSTHA